MTCIARLLDRVHAWLYQRRYDAHVRALRRAGIVVTSVVVLTACGGVERHARTALDVTAHALVATDSIVAEVYEQRAAEVLAVATSLDDYRARMEPLDRTEAALRVARGALLAAESGLDAEDEDTLGIVGCVADAMDHLLDALAAIDVDPPPKLRRAIDAVRAIAGDRCEVSR